MSTYINRKRLEILGKEFMTNRCGTCVVIGYNNALDATVKFYNPEYVTKCRVGDLVRGEVLNPIFPLYNGRGYIGVGKFTTKNTKAYSVWRGILRRTENIENLPKIFNSYKDVSICEEWYNFQNFAEWCESQEFFRVKDDKGENYALDKDILIKGNKIYSPETCCFVPRTINSLFISKGVEFKKYGLPIGVTYHKDAKKFSSKVTTKRKTVNLGLFNTSDDAFLAYKKSKEAIIKQLAEDWKGRVDVKVYEALVKWEVDIRD